MNKRSSIFGNPAPAPMLDVGDFQPKARPETRPPPAEIDAASRFKSREAAPEDLVNLPSTKRKPMTYRTGRNVVLSIKTSQEMVDRFYSLAETKGWKVGETFERALEALSRES